MLKVSYNIWKDDISYYAKSVISYHRVLIDDNFTKVLVNISLIKVLVDIGFVKNIGKC